MSFRNQFKNRRKSLLTPWNHDRASGVVFFSMSVFVHGLFFGGLIFFHNFRKPKPLPPVIQIDLVSFSPDPVLEEPAKNEEISKKEGIPTKKTSIKKKNQKIPTKKADISLKTKPKNLKDLIAIQEKKKKEPEKKKEKIVEKVAPQEKIDENETLEETKQDMEKKVVDENNERIAQALSRLQKKVKEQGKAKTSDGQGTYQGYGKKGYKPIDLYKMVIGSAIEQNWVFNETLARMDQELEVRILIKILKSGKIRDIIYETKSGNRYLDESAKKAIKKTDPLPQLPSGMRSWDVVVIFTPKGLR